MSIQHYSIVAIIPCLIDTINKIGVNEGQFQGKQNQMFQTPHLLYFLRCGLGWKCCLRYFDTTINLFLPSGGLTLICLFGLSFRWDMKVIIATSTYTTIALMASNDVDNFWAISRMGIKGFHSWLLTTWVWHGTIWKWWALIQKSTRWPSYMYKSCKIIMY